MSRAACLVVLLAAVAGGGGRAHAGDGKRALQLLPADTALVVSIDLRRVKGSWLFAPLQKLAHSSAGIARVLSLLESGAGVALAGLDTAVVALDRDFDRNEHIAVALEGAIDRAKLAALARARPKVMRALIHARVAYYRIDDAVDVVPMRGHLLLTNRGRGAALIDAARFPAQRLAASARMMAAIDATDTSKQMWGAFVLPPRLKAALSRAAPALRLTSISISADTRGGLRAAVRATTASPAAATALAAAFAAGKKQLAREPSLVRRKLAEMIQSMRAARNGAVVELGLRATLAQVRELGMLLGNI